MSKYRFMVVFITSVVLATAITDQCQIALMERCIKAYQEDLKATTECRYEEGKGQKCQFFKHIMTCLANEPKCGGELIEKLRYWSLQSAMMDNILGACEDMDYTALKSIVQQSDVGKTHGFLDDVEYETSDACALTVHKECLRYYLALLKRHKMCEDAEKVNKCYVLYSRSIGCQSKIIQRYASMVEDVAHQFLKLMQNYMKPLCDSAAEL